MAAHPSARVNGGSPACYRHANTMRLSVFPCEGTEIRVVHDSDDAPPLFVLRELLPCFPRIKSSVATATIVRALGDEFVTKRAIDGKLRICVGLPALSVLLVKSPSPAGLRILAHLGEVFPSALQKMPAPPTESPRESGMIPVRCSSGVVMLPAQQVATLMDLPIAAIKHGAKTGRHPSMHPARCFDMDQIAKAAIVTPVFVADFADK